MGVRVASFSKANWCNLKRAIPWPTTRISHLRFYNFPDFEYGRRLGRTPGSLELGLVDFSNDQVIHKVGGLIDDYLKPLGKEEWQMAQCFDMIFGIACDPSPSGYQYDFTGKIPCPVCGSPDSRYDKKTLSHIDLTRVTHDAWQQLSEAQKRDRVRQALQKAGCIP